MKAYIIEVKALPPSKKSGISWTIVKLLVYGDRGVELKQKFYKTSEITDDQRDLLVPCDLSGEESVTVLFDSTGNVESVS